MKGVEGRGGGICAGGEGVYEEGGAGVVCMVDG